MHYKDGTPAAIGDKVAGVCFNTPGQIVGVVVRLTEGAASCNCVIAFAQIIPNKDSFYQAGSGADILVGGDRVSLRYDYGTVGDFQKIA